MTQLASSSKGPGPNNPEQVAKFREETNKALLTFIDNLHSLDRYKAKDTCKYFVHTYLNELLKTNQTYYKNASIYPVLETIEDKFCKVMFEPDEEQVQQTPDDIEDSEEFIHKLKMLEDFANFSKEVARSLTVMFTQLQLCHRNSAKLAGHMVHFGKTLEPAQFTYVMKHSLRLLVQLSIPPHLCSPAELKFDKIHLTPAETKEERAVNLMLFRPFHPSLASLPPKHATWALAAAIHTVLRKHVFNSQESPNSICEEFQIVHKKLYEVLTGKQYDPGIKLTKAEKAQRETEAKLKKLKTTDSKGDQDKDKENTTSTSDMTPTTMDTTDMPQLISSDEETPKGGARRKRFVSKKPPPQKPWGK